MTLKLVHCQELEAKALGKKLAEIAQPIAPNRLTAMDLTNNQVKCHGTRYGDFTWLLDGMAPDDPERPLIESLLKILSLVRDQYRAVPETNSKAHHAIGQAWGASIQALRRYETLKNKVK